VGQYYLRLDVTDKPGVLARIASVFGDNGVSIKSVVQEGTEEQAQLVFITHSARESALQATVAALTGLPVVAGVRSVLRVEGEE
jgi:homoserine dehydrogenase